MLEKKMSAQEDRKFLAKDAFIAECKKNQGPALCRSCCYCGVFGVVPFYCAQSAEKMPVDSLVHVS